MQRQDAIKVALGHFIKLNLEAFGFMACPGSSGVEQWIENPRVGGSIPPLGTIITNYILKSYR